MDKVSMYKNQIYKNAEEESKLKSHSKTTLSKEIQESLDDTNKHIANVASKINHISAELYTRGINHDHSKTESPELEAYAIITPRLKGSTYGSDEYKASLREMKPAIDHHYANNSHHPENHANGISDMNLVDIVEMFCDWLAASERHADGDIMKSIDTNEKRFNMSPELAQIFRNTVKIFKK